MAGIWDDIQKQFKSRSMLSRIIIVNAVVWLVTIIMSVIVGRLLGDHTLNAYLNTQGYYLGVPADLTHLLLRPWTVITHMFTHDVNDIFHLAFNMMGVYFLGQLWVYFVGERKLLSTYILGGWAGMLAFIAVYNLFPALPTNTVAVGASAAVYAIAAACGAYQPKFVVRLFGVMPIKLGWLVVIFVGMDLIRLNAGDNFGGHLAHLGGAAFGFVQGSQLKSGQDKFIWMDRFLDKLFNFFKFNRSRLKVVKKSRKRGGFSDEEYNQLKYKNQKKTDRILDKISKSGYESLTKDEKDFLFNQSKE